MKPSELLKQNYSKLLELFAKYPEIEKARVFGSVSRGEDTEDSDLDIMITYPVGTCLFTLGGLQNDIEELFPSIKIDLINERHYPDTATSLMHLIYERKH
ncbi:Nucleotidyltransferase domain [Oligella urethralis]|uniref:nucleotidyltransferase family protein n=1 Tax=Oligella urethralis TaxID=90245 RepID=UPI000C9A17B4|nr:nucleotidyltransferase domain-containing protein [Oligella urethralis]PMC17782.1 nucleotidyltransferase [Oligella urethralis]SUA55857.1 Nucleotidyltransferase domain [Oligella urethralis]